MHQKISIIFHCTFQGYKILQAMAGAGDMPLPLLWRIGIPMIEMHPLQPILLRQFEMVMQNDPWVVLRLHLLQIGLVRTRICLRLAQMKVLQSVPEESVHALRFALEKRGIGVILHLRRDNDRLRISHLGDAVTLLGAVRQCDMLEAEVVETLVVTAHTSIFGICIENMNLLRIKLLH